MQCAPGDPRAARHDPGRSVRARPAGTGIDASSTGAYHVRPVAPGRGADDSKDDAVPNDVADLLATWRELERLLDRLATDAERAAEIRDRIGELRASYLELTSAARSSMPVLDRAHAAIDRSRELLRGTTAAAGHRARPGTDPGRHRGEGAVS